MADFLQYLAILDSDPDDTAALAGLAAQAPRAAGDPASLAALADTRKNLRERGRVDVVARLLDVEIGAVQEPSRRADLLLEKGLLLEEDLLDENAAVECFRQVLTLRPGDETATENLQQIGDARENWEKFAGKNIEEAKVSTDRQLTTHLYLSAAELYARHRPGAPEVEQYLRRALEVDPRNRRAAMHLERLLRAAARWPELAALLEQRIESASSREERVAALLGLADVYRAHLGAADRAVDQVKKVIAIDPAQPQAIKSLADAYEQAENWTGLVALYSAALKARRGSEKDELGMLLQVGMILWRRLGDLDAAEDYFRRIRKVEPAHPAALDFYRAYYPPRGESQKLLALLRQAEKAVPAGMTSAAADARARALAIEIAELAESSGGSPEKAIEAWKQMLRADPSSAEARTSLERLYRKTEKWNALLDLMKEEIDRLPESDTRGRIDRLLEVVDIYRDRLKLDVMVINTFNTILKLDPDHPRALDELAAKYKQLGRWNDLIGVLSKKAELGGAPVAERVAILREVADLWSERFGNFAQAIRPLERLLELSPTDADALARLKDIYTRRRQWRQLIGLVQKEADAAHGADRRAKQSEMARLAAERLGDSRLAIEIYNQLLAESDPSSDLTEALAALAGLYEREKRWLALAEILRRQRERVKTAAEAVPILERLGALLADRAGAPSLAAQVLGEILELDPSHGKALRTMRELYAQAHDYDGLEGLYGKLGQWDELVDALVGIADRMDDKAARLAVLERAAGVAQKRAEAAPSEGGPKKGQKADAFDRASRVWERVLGVDPHHAGAAAALAPIYARAEKWSRLVPILEIQLHHAKDDKQRRKILSEIRTICEQKLGSRALAFTWTGHAADLDPGDDKLVADLLRLAQEPEQWREILSLFDRHVPRVSETKGKLALLREQAKIAATKLHDPERARDYERAVLALAPDDTQAEAHLEELASHLSDWPELLASYRRRADRANGAERVALLFKAAAIEEERLADLDAAADTYRAVLAIDSGSLRALHALARVEEARGDWDGLDQVLDAELAIADDPEQRYALLMRLGALEEKSLDRPGAALARYRKALDILDRGFVRTAPLEAATRFLDGSEAPAKAIALGDRAKLAEQLLPHFEKARDPHKIARALEVLRAGGTTTQPELAIDRRLVALYAGELADPARAWEAAGRVHQAAPTDDHNRMTLHRLAGGLGKHAELAQRLAFGLAAAQKEGNQGQVRAIGAELAQVSSELLGDTAGAEKAWIAVLGAEHDAPDAFASLGQIYRGAARWTDLRALLERRVEVTMDDRVRKAALVELAQLEEDVLNDPKRATAAHVRILDLDPTDLHSYKALERLYAEAEQWKELEALLAREHDVAPDKEQAALYYRRAELRAHRLNDKPGSVDLLEQVVARHKSHADGRELLEELLPEKPLRLRIARLLEPLYEGDKLWKDLVLVLRAQRELAGGPTEASQLLARIAAIEEERLDNARAAFETWTEALILDPTDEHARAALRRLGGALDRWPEVTAAWEKAVEKVPSSDTATRAALYSELGEMYDVQLGDAARATGAYERLLGADPHGPATSLHASHALARLYEEEGRWKDLVAILRKQAEASDSPDDRNAIYVRVAKLEEDQLADPKAAIATWRDILGDDPDHPAALDALERMYQGRSAWPELVEILRRRVSLSGPDVAKQYLRRVAELQETLLASQADAIAAHLEILDHVPDDPETLGELARLYRAQGRHLELLDILERRLAIAPVKDNVVLQAEIAELLAGPLGRDADALERWARVLAIAPAHALAASAVEQELDDPDLRGRAVEILRPLYESTGQDGKLAQLLAHVAGAADDVRERMIAWGEVGAIREHRLGDTAGAFDARVKALEAAVAEPELGAALGEVERLAADLGREGDLIDVYKRIAPDVLDGEVQRRLYLDVADLARAVRGDVNLARDHYARVLDGQPDDRRALNALESIYREAGEHAKLWEILSRKAELAGQAGELDDQVACLAEAAQLCAGPLRRPEEAVLGWEQVLELEPDRKDAVAALENLYAGGKRWHDLVDLHERRLGFAYTIEDAVALRVRLGDIHDRELRDPHAAVDSYAAALSGDPNNKQALGALEKFLDDPAVRAAAAEVLEPIYVARHDWPRLARIWEIELEAAADANERLRLTWQVARLYEEQLEDFEGAMRWYAKLFREAPADPGIRDQLHRLASVLDNWGELARVYQEHLDDNPGDAPEIRDIALAAAAIYDRRTGDVERGQAAYRRALAVPQSSPATVPDDREIFRRLEALLVRAEKWGMLVEVYEEALGAASDDARRLELHRKIADVEENRRDNSARAIDAYREMTTIASAGATLGSQAAYEEATSQLDRLYRAKGQWYDLADLYNARIERADANREIELRIGLAEVLEHQLSDTTGAIEQYELVLSTNAGWERALLPLERLVVVDEHRERIAELLEPVYRKHDWWQKLVVILDAKLAFIDDPHTKVETLGEIARIHETRGGDPDLAFDALARAWKIDVSDGGVFDELVGLGARLGAWDELVATLEGGVAGAFDPDVSATVMARVAEIHEAQRADHTAAITAWRKVLEHRPDEPIALSGLDRLLAIEGRAAELVEVVERRAELADDAGVRLVLLHRVASLYEEILERPREAIAAYKNVLGVDEADLAALDALERLYRIVAEPSELAQTLVRKLELTIDPPERRRLRLAAAEVYDKDLRDPYEAIAMLAAVLTDDAGDAFALAELDRLYAREKMWPELLDVVDRRALLATAAQERADLAFRAAQLVERELVEPEAAIPRYGAVLQILPTHAGARGALEALTQKDEHLDPASAVLERVYRAETNVDALVRLYERRLKTSAPDPIVRRAQWQQLAEVHEILRADPASASATWARALTESPDDLELYGPLERLAGARGAWDELGALLQTLVDKSPVKGDAEVEYAYCARLASIYEDALGDLDRAATTLRRAATLAPDERVPLAALDRVLARGGKHAELGEVLAREAEAAPDDVRAAEFMFRLGDLRETSLGDAAGAVAAYREVLLRVPRHPAGRAALERLLTTAEKQRADIIDTLEPLYESENEWGRLADLLAAKLAVTIDHQERSEIYQRIADLAETRLGDNVRALDAVGGWLAEEPSSTEAIAELDRLAASLGRWGEAAARLTGIAQNVDDPHARLPLLLHLGQIQLDRLADTGGAAQTYRDVLELDAESTVALDALARIHRVAGDLAGLSEVQWRRGELAFDPAEKRKAFVETAQLRERLARYDGAIEAWRKVLDLDDADREALDHLAALHERRGDLRALVETLVQAARYADGQEEKRFKTRVAQLYAQLGDQQAAIAAWREVADLDPNDPTALGELENAHAAAGDWLAVQDVLTRRQELAKTSAEKVAILARMAYIAEHERKSLDDAAASWIHALDIDNAHLPAYGELERIYTQAQRWHDLVELLERLAELLGTLGRSDDEIQALARAADVWEGPLENPDAAGEILEKILRREPGSVAALTRLAKIYEKSGDWDKCTEVLGKALALGPRGRDAADLFFRLGEVANKNSGDLETAVAHWRQALTHDAAHAPTIAALEKVARDKGDLVTLSDLLARRAATAAPADRLTIALELADVHKKLGRPDAAIPLLERAVADAPTDVRIIGPLADLYFAAGMLDRAAPLYDKLAEDAKAARRMKEVAKYRQRQGGILEARGELPGALAAYEEAFRVNPTDVPTMAGLGRIYMGQRDWEKARRVYRSLVLQNIDPEAGVTKADVYFALGVIHVELGEAPKAKGMFQRGLELEPGNDKLKQALAQLG
ncbi:MAG TPA: tetratricopeptide repeat protein [Kofleriaceae bacterium]|nr:tetratricopeptide repeat protein [Kofleriaceae bacterium]